MKRGVHDIKILISAAGSPRQLPRKFAVSDACADHFVRVSRFNPITFTVYYSEHTVWEKSTLFGKLLCQ